MNQSVSDERISVSDAADELGMLKQTAFRVLRRLGITPTKEKSEQHRGQAISFITQEDFERLADNYTASSNSDEPVMPSSQGIFYLIQLEPGFDPGRFKVGFTTGLKNRLRHLRCSAPFAVIVQTWPCKLLWEKTAMECVTQGCEQLHTEVFRTTSLDVTVEKASTFFSQMPVEEEAAADN